MNNLANKIKQFARIYAEAFLVMCGIMFTYIFVKAYIHPSKSVIVNINRYHEADLELALIILGSVLVIFFYYRNIRYGEKLWT